MVLAVKGKVVGGVRNVGLWRWLLEVVLVAGAGVGL